MNTARNYWRLHTDRGRQVWHFSREAAGRMRDASDPYWETPEGSALLQDMWNDFHMDRAVNANSADRVYRAQACKDNGFKPLNPSDIPAFDTQDVLLKDIFSSVFKGIHFYKHLLTPEGHIPGDYGGPMFLLPGLTIVSYVTGNHLPAPHRLMIRRYMHNAVNSDGGWGLHIEDKSTMYGTVLQYTALRLLGEPADSPVALNARRWIHENGGATGVPSWGKFYLSVLGAYEWDGCNSLFPELWIFPEWIPFHPWRYWCHARMVYLPMAYCYGAKVTGPLTDLVKELRTELYTVPYEKISWKEARNACCPKDVYRKSTPMLRLMHSITNTYEKIRIPLFRKKALNFLLRYIQAEDSHTNYINIGPVNQVINSLSIWHGKGADSEEFRKHTERWYDYLWVAEDGMKMQGYNGAQFWETAFTANAIMDGPANQYFKPELERMHLFIQDCQILPGLPEENRFYRHPNRGGFPFSTKAHGWPITDCTGDGIKVSLKLDECTGKTQRLISPELLAEGVDLLLSFQSKDGGWASYEIRRAPQWIEVLNPSEVFGEIMVDYSYVECTSSVVQGLHAYHKRFPDYRPDEIRQAMERGFAFIRTNQRSDGSWYGSWGICFTYAAWFALEALELTGETFENSETVRKGCEFLLSKQNPDGGWGEHFLSCVEMRYVPHEQSQIINTAWSLLALIAASYPRTEATDKAARFLMSRQEDSGDFPQEAISGVFNKNCMETYTSYRNVFPIWALNKYVRYYRD